MANKTIAMLQIRRILQLLQRGYSKRQISKELGISRNTVDEYQKKFLSSGLSHARLSELSEGELSEAIKKETPAEHNNPRYQSLLEKIPFLLKELKKPGVTRLLLWQEYLQDNPDGYSYGQFCWHLGEYKEKQCVTMHLEHIPGDCLQIDFAGQPLHYVNRETGELLACSVLVCVLPYSGYTYVEALPSAASEHLFPALGRCMTFLGGVSKNVLSDNLKQVVTKSNRYEPVFSQLAQQWSLHYNTNLVAARVVKPKDKPSVEKGVDLAYKRIYAPLRDKEFYSLDELNYYITGQLSILNNTLMQKRGFSRHERFLSEEKPMLGELPPEGFTIKHTTKAKIQKNYHVILGEDWHQYSVPHQYIGKEVKIIYDDKEVEVYLGLQRVSVHRRDYRKHGYSTLAEHMPESHRRWKEIQGWDAAHFIGKARRIGPHTTIVIEKMLASRTFAEQTYHACLGVLRLGEKYTPQRLEAACKRACRSSKAGYMMINNILKNNLDKQIDTQLKLTLPNHDNIRGANSYE